jgi:hypothetical protein
LTYHHPFNSPDLIFSAALRSGALRDAKIVYSKMDRLQKTNEGLRGDSPATGSSGLAIPLHPGSDRFFGEQGEIE